MNGNKHKHPVIKAVVGTAVGIGILAWLINASGKSRTAHIVIFGALFSVCYLVCTYILGCGIIMWLFTVSDSVDHTMMMVCLVISVVGGYATVILNPPPPGTFPTDPLPPPPPDRPTMYKKPAPKPPKPFSPFDPIGTHPNQFRQCLTYKTKSLAEDLAAWGIVVFWTIFIIVVLTLIYRP
jgi:hypothetical protein